MSGRRRAFAEALAQRVHEPLVAVVEQGQLARRPIVAAHEDEHVGPHHGAAGPRRPLPMCAPRGVVTGVRDAHQHPDGPRRFEDRRRRVDALVVPGHWVTLSQHIWGP
jgi:hypothetical protein